MRPSQSLFDTSNARPVVLSERDPWAGDAFLHPPHDRANYLRYADPPHLDEEAYSTAVDRFHEAWVRAVEGTLAVDDLEEPARALGLWGPSRHDRRRPMSAPAPISDDELADLVEDWVPDIGVAAPDRILGPFSLLPISPRLRCATAAAMVGCYLLHPMVRPGDRAMRDQGLSQTVRSTVRAVVRAPGCLFRRDDDGLYRTVLEVAGIPEAVPFDIPGDPPFCFGRPVPTDTIWWLSGRIALPAVPPVPVLERRMMLELMRIRLFERRATWEDTLRDAADTVIRTACEWCALEGCDLRPLNP